MVWAYRDLAAFRGSAGDIAGAGEALARFVATRPDLTVGEVGDALRFIEPKTVRRYLGGLRAAGLPD